MVMKKSSIVLLLAMIYIFCYATPSFAQEKVGVLDFGGKTPTEFRLSAGNKLFSILLDLGYFDLIAREEMARVLGEENFLASQSVEETIETGRMLAANLLFTGSIEQLSSHWDSKVQRYRGEAGITVKIIQVQTGRVLHLLVRTGYGSSENREKSLHLALENCFAGDFMVKLKEIFALNGTITKVDGDSIYFFNGKDLGIKKGQRFRVLRTEFEEFEELKIRTAFQREIGLVEVIAVGDNISKAKLIWNSLPILLEDTVEEVEYPEKKLLSFEIGVSNKYTTEAFTGETSAKKNHRYPLALNLKLGRELPFKHSGFLHLGVISVPTVKVFNFGIEGGFERPLSKGFFYFTLSGETGLALAFQQLSSQNASCLGYYLKVGGGGKMYFNREQGPRINLRIFGQYGPKLTPPWKDNEGKTVTPSIQRLDFTGFGLEVGFSIPF